MNNIVKKLEAHDKQAKSYTYKIIKDTGMIKHDANHNLYMKGKYNLYQLIPESEEVSAIRMLFTSESQLFLASRNISDIANSLKDDPDLLLDTEIVNTGEIVFENGFYNCIKKVMLEEYPYEYVEAKCCAHYKENVTIEDAPNFLRFVKTSLDYDVSTERTQLLLQIIGYIISDFNSAKKAFFLLGPPSCGKSVILTFLKHVVGEEYVSEIPFGKISDRFATGQLYGKRVNISGELAEGSFPKLDIFKSITGGDMIFGEKKGKDGFFYQPRVKLINAGNTMPIPQKNDGTKAISDRLCFLIFPHSVEKKEWNINLIEELLQEKDVICSLAVNELKGLLDSNFLFIQPEDSQKMQKVYEEQFNVLDIFMNEECTIAKGESVSSLELWKKFEDFCLQNCMGKRNITIQVFIAQVASIPGVEKKRVRRNGRQETILYGIGTKTEINAITENLEKKKERKNVFGGTWIKPKIRECKTNCKENNSSCTREVKK